MSEGPSSLLCVSIREVEPFVNAGPLSGVQSDTRFSIKVLDCVGGARAKTALSVATGVQPRHILTVVPLSARSGASIEGYVEEIGKCVHKGSWVYHPSVAHHKCSVVNLLCWVTGRFMAENVNKTNKEGV